MTKPRTTFKLLTNFHSFGKNLFGRSTRYQTWTRYVRFRQISQGYANLQLLDRAWETMPDPAVSPEIMVELQRNLPGWGGFQQEVFTYVQMNWNDMFGDFDDVVPGAALVREIIPSGPRGRLAQIFAACPPGSYGYYAQYGLAPFRLLVGNTAAADIDTFFAQNIRFLKQPMSNEVRDLMSMLETKYWRSRQDLVDWVAGTVLTENRRRAGVSVPATLTRLVEGYRRTELGAEELTTEQLTQIQSTLRQGIDEMTLEAVQRRASELADQMIRENLVEIEDGYRESD
jgi:hypothetical protein